MSEQKKQYLATIFHLQDRKLDFQSCDTIENAQEFFKLSISNDEWIDECSTSWNEPFSIVIEDVYHVQLAVVA
jgi:hypothetical protein